MYCVLKTGSVAIRRAVSFTGMLDGSDSGEDDKAERSQASISFPRIS